MFSYLDVQSLVCVHPGEKLDLALLVIEGVLADVHLTDRLGEYPRLPGDVAAAPDVHQDRVPAQFCKILSAGGTRS